MTDPTAVYRTVQVVTSSPAEQIVLLYQGALRFAGLHLAALGRGDLEAAHHASLRAQAIVSGLQEVLDPDAGAVAANLDGLYDFILRRLVEGNVRKAPEPTREAIDLLVELTAAWRTIAGPITTPATATISVSGSTPESNPAGARPIAAARPVGPPLPGVPAGIA